MTREEALEYVTSMATGHHDNATSNHYHDIRKVVKEIYDDFESRTCENCKFEKTIGFDNTCDGCVRQYSRVDRWKSKND